MAAQQRDYAIRVTETTVLLEHCYCSCVRSVNITALQAALGFDRAADALAL